MMPNHLLLGLITLMFTSFMFQVHLAEHRGSTNWGDRKSNQHKSSQIKFWVLVRGENRSSRGKTSRLFLLPGTTLTCHTAKIMEGFTLSRVLPGITERLDPKQFAMAGKATQHAIVYPLHLLLEALDQGNCWAKWFFADFKKRFRPCGPSYPIR